jgi:hypothetical protein
VCLPHTTSDVVVSAPHRKGSYFLVGHIEWDTVRKEDSKIFILDSHKNILNDVIGEFVAILYTSD